MIVLLPFASIPSPSNGVLHLGPLSLHAYGLCIALGVLAATWLAGRRWAARGGERELATTVALWAVPAGIAGARLYHVITTPDPYRAHPWRAFAIWDGGLGIWGGIAVGALAGALVARRHGAPPAALMDAAAPGLALAQAIGRWGNYWNQELFGSPTSLPWGLEIDPRNRPEQYVTVATFHPTFLYESLYDAALCLLLVLGTPWALRRRWPGDLFLLYVAGYTFGRFFIERVRIDFAHSFLGLRVNEWTSVVVFIAAVALLLRPRRADSRRSQQTATGPAEERHQH